MATAVRISQQLVSEARKFSKVDHRSLTGQIEHWARIGKCAEENPDLTYDFIKEIFIGIEELNQGEKTEYKLGWNPMKIYQSRSFENKVKKFNKKEKTTLDNEIKKIVQAPSSTGTEKKGDLRGIFVHKFKIQKQLYLLSYRTVSDGLELIMIGPHENYYRDLKIYLKK